MTEQDEHGPRSAAAHWAGCREDIRAQVALLASDASVQFQYIDGGGYPVDELVLGLFDMWPQWSGGLLGSGVMTEADGEALDGLVAYLTGLLRAAPEAWVDERATLDRAEWSEVRLRASHVRVLLGSLGESR